VLYSYILYDDTRKGIVMYIRSVYITNIYTYIKIVHKYAEYVTCVMYFN